MFGECAHSASASPNRIGLTNRYGDRTYSVTTLGATNAPVVRQRWQRAPVPTYQPLARSPTTASISSMIRKLVRTPTPPPTLQRP